MERAEENTGDWQRRVASNQVVQIPMPASHREKKPRGDDEQCKAEPGQSDAAQSRDGAAWRHNGLGVTCKPNSDSRAGINSSEEQKVNRKAERCHAEHKQPGLLEMQLFELDRRLVTKKAELG